MLRAAAGHDQNAPRPIDSAPPLFTLNGFGVGLYGKRDRWPNGAYVATYCVCALFVPVFPLTAYRVFEHGGGRYGFVAKERLSGFARAYRALVLAAVVGMVALTGVAGYLGYLAHGLFKDSLIFPFALTLLGLAVIGAGLWWQRHEQRLTVRLRARLPSALRELLASRG